jgi:periplasmic divalent cation tolerance protein
MVNKDREIVLALATFPGEEVAAALARQLLAEGLVACVNILPGVRSLYRWEGEVQDEPEVLAFMKSRRELADELVERLVELHPYETPAVSVLSPHAVAREYGAWVTDELRGAGDR